MLIDKVSIIIKAGNGGNGAATFRRNAQTARGGPDGGNGGNGASVYFQGVDDILGLREFRYKKRIEAEKGVNGGKQNLFGKNGTNLVVAVPIGTLVTNKKTGESFEITDTTKTLVAQGGIGGRGNNEFKSATNQAPRYAEKGTPGEEKDFLLELKIIADVGLIGLPNAGKSSLLHALTHANPKVGNYPFTTLEPNIGMLENISMADNPGLIEGAHEGKGLGIEFLRHIEKTKLLVHCIEATTPNVLESYSIVTEELAKYSNEKALPQKEEIIVLTKVDEVDEKTKQEKIQSLQKFKKTVLSVSILEEESLKKLAVFLINAVKKD
jgi:GTP-binding protein